MRYKELADALDNFDEDCKQRDQIAAILRSLDAQPVFWYRPTCGGKMYEGPVHNNSVGGKMLRAEKPGEWKPLYAAPVAAQQAKPEPLSDAEILACANDNNGLPPWGIGSWRGNYLDGVRRAITAFCQKNGIKEQG